MDKKKYLLPFFTRFAIILSSFLSNLFCKFIFPFTFSCWILDVLISNLCCKLSLSFEFLSAIFDKLLANLFYNFSLSFVFSFCIFGVLLSICCCQRCCIWVMSASQPIRSFFNSSVTISNLTSKMFLSSCNCLACAYSY